jgi:nucleoid DNA-binding protein
MDIAKYIGLYLLKNNFCYIHGLGNLELKKKPAAHDGQAIQGPLYEVSLTPTGSIDDSLANFIATHEQTSISKAANCLRDFSIETRTALQEGKEVAIPALGKFTQQNGIIRFITDPHLQYTPPSIPILRTAKRLEEAPSFKTTSPSDDSYSRTGGISGGQIGIGLAIIAILAAVIFFGMKFFGGKDQEPTVVEQTNNQPVPVEVAVPDTTVRDTVIPPPAVSQPVTTASADGLNRVILGTYTNRAAAEKRVKTLTGNGNTVELIAKDSSSFYVIMPIAFAPADSAKTLDSLRKMFNPKGVSIYR